MDELRYVTACRVCQWHLQLWSKDEPGKRWMVPYTCGSWRHEGECARWKGAQDFVRCREAIEAHDHWTYLVLTYPARDWPDKGALYKFGVVSWARLRKRLGREFGTLRYIQTWEQHRSGYPHCNCLISCQKLHEFCCAHPSLSATGQMSIAEKHIGRIARACGFGWRTSADPMRSAAAMCGYLVKLAAELTGADSKDQRPVEAPRHFRRLRASVRLLPPVAKNPDLSGIMVFRPMTRPDGEIIEISI